MPGRDGTGPAGTGGGMGRGQGRGGGMRGMRQGGGKTTGPFPNGFCVCPQCGEKLPHQPGKPCTTVQCHQCGSLMVRE